MPIKKSSSSLNLIDNKNKTKMTQNPKESLTFASIDKYSMKENLKYKT